MSELKPSERSKRQPPGAASRSALDAGAECLPTHRSSRCSRPIDNAPIIQVRDLFKTYRVGEVDVHALNGVSLDVARGEFLAIVGTSGSGKSTLFNILGGLTPPTSGSVAINGRDLSNMTDAERNDLRKRTVGFVFQKYNLLPTLTAEQNIQIVRHVAGRPLKFDDQLPAKC